MVERSKFDCELNEKTTSFIRHVFKKIEGGILFVVVIIFFDPSIHEYLGAVLMRLRTQVWALRAQTFVLRRINPKCSYKFSKERSKNLFNLPMFSK